MSRKTELPRLLTAATVLLGILALVFVPIAAADDSPSVTVIAGGLDNPRGLAFGSDGALYVVEAGRGDPGCAEEDRVDGPFGPACYGPTGAVTRILDGQQERIATGLSSFASPEGRQAFGPHDISFGQDGAFVVVGACFASNDSCGRLLHLSDGGEWRESANITAWELDNNVDNAHEGESNAYAVLPLSDERIVVDAAGNTLLRVSPNGDISLLALFPPRSLDGGETQMDAVPTSVVMGPDGAFYVPELTGFPFPAGEARIYRVEPGEDPYAEREVFAEGFTNVIDIAFGDDGSLYVLEMAANGIPAGPEGALIRITPDGFRETILDHGLVSPAGVAIGDNGAIYVTNYGEDAGKGEVVSITLPASVPQEMPKTGAEPTVGMSLWLVLLAGAALVAGGWFLRRKRIYM
ncbi:MAG: ScyD/ScyE family protein [Anaerolineae bacterium]